VTAWDSWGEADPYCWIVICKNRKFHSHQNIYSGHKIPLGETDEFTPPPQVDTLMVRCDECGTEHSYAAADDDHVPCRFADVFPQQCALARGDPAYRRCRVRRQGRGYSERIRTWFRGESEFPKSMYLVAVLSRPQRAQITMIDPYEGVNEGWRTHFVHGQAV
jgi:hypothetical protein